MAYSSPLESFAHRILCQPPKRFDSQERRERIIAAALRVCARTGPLNLKISEVAETAGVSTATIYKEFENSDAVLAATILCAFDMLMTDWSLTPVPPPQQSTLRANASAFLLKFGETYHHAFSNWILRADLVTMVTQDPDVLVALIGFQDRILEYGIKSLPELAFGFAERNDLVHILVGAIQAFIVSTLLSADPNQDAEPTSNLLGLPKVIEVVLNWVEHSPQRPNPSRYPQIAKATGQLKTIELQKSDVQKHAEALLSVTNGRADRQARRSKIMAATMHQCAALGIDNADIATIARLAGVSTASVYKEFADKSALIQGSVAHFIPVYAQATMQAINEADPAVRLYAMLKAQAITLADPFGAWLFRYYIELEASGDGAMKALGQATRDQSNLFWSNQIERLESEGYLEPTDHDVTRMMIFGGVHRRCVQARLLRKDEALVWAEIDASVTASTNMLFRLYGKPIAFGANDADVAKPHFDRIG